MLHKVFFLYLEEKNNHLWIEWHAIWAEKFTNGRRCKKWYKLNQTKPNPLIFFSQPRQVRYRDGVQQMTILDPRPHERSTLPDKSGRAICIFLVHNSMPARLSLSSWLKPYYLMSLILKVLSVHMFLTPLAAKLFRQKAFWSNGFRPNVCRPNDTAAFCDSKVYPSLASQLLNSLDWDYFWLRAEEEEEGGKIQSLFFFMFFYVLGKGICGQYFKQVEEYLVWQHGKARAFPW